MDALDYILQGLENELQLERELGVKELEVSAKVEATRPPPPPPPPSPPSPAQTPVKPQVSAAPTASALVFLHDRPLSVKGAEIMAKIIAALGRDEKTAPIVTEGALPKARVLVVLGARALKRWLPEQHAEPGAWLTLPNGCEALVTYSPEFFLRFKTVTPQVMAAKKSMWEGIKRAAEKGK